MKIHTIIYLYFTLFILLFLNACTSKKESLNQQETVHEISIVCDQNAFDEAYENYSENTYIPCTVTYKNKTYKGVKMRVRGDTSREKPKKSLKLKFDKKNLFLDSLESINLNAEYSDKSLIRQKLSSEIFKEIGVPCFSAEYVSLTMNNSFFGVYLKVENMDKHFLKRNQLSPKSNLYKATKDGACLSTFDNIPKKWEKKAGKDLSFFDLDQLIKNINNTPVELFDEFLKEHFKYTQIIRVLAANMFIANGSTYYHNYYMFHNTTGDGKWQMFPWDLDKSISYYAWKPYKYHQTSSNWESDNPLVEKALLNKIVLSDIKKELDNIQSKINKTWVENKVSLYAQLLEPLVVKDTSNKVVSIKKWTAQLEKEKKFLLNRSNDLKQQIETYPSSFELYKTPNYCNSNVRFSWKPSKGAKSYTLLLSQDFLFEKEGTQRIELTKTSHTVKGLKNGKYYWQVIAENKHGKTRGFNSKNVFEVVTFTRLEGDLSDDLTINAKDHYLISGNVTVPKNKTIKLKPGVTLHFTKNGQLSVKGSLIAKGSEKKPIVFTNSSDTKSWECVYLLSAEKAMIDHAIFNEGLLNMKHSKVHISNSSFQVNQRQMEFENDLRPSIIWSHKSDVTINNINIKGNGKGEGMNFNFGQVNVNNSRFTNVPDAIEFINVTDGKIQYNTVVNCLDDAIDMNGCTNVEVSYNSLMNNVDKGVSIGTEQYGKSTNISIHHNIIVGNGIGVSVKDSSVAVVSNNTFFKNNKGIQAYRKREGYLVGGTIDLTNNIIEKSKNVDVYCDKNSTVNSKNNVGSKLKGKGLKAKDPKFNSASGLDFRTPNKQGATHKSDRLVYISEVNAGSKKNKSSDYIKIASNTSSPINISGWTLIIDGKKQNIQPVTLEPMNSVFVAKKPSLFYQNNGFYPSAFLSKGFKAPKKIQLLDSKGALHDEWHIKTSSEGLHKRD